MRGVGFLCSDTLIALLSYGRTMVPLWAHNPEEGSDIRLLLLLFLWYGGHLLLFSFHGLPCSKVETDYLILGIQTICSRNEYDTIVPRNKAIN